MTDARRFIEENIDPVNYRRREQSPMRFSLLSMLVLTTLMAVVCAIVFAFPPAIGALICMFLQPCLIAGLLGGALVAKSDLRYFCIGALVPFVQTVFPGGSKLGDWNTLFSAVAGRRVYSAANRNNPNDSIWDYLMHIHAVLEQTGKPLMTKLMGFSFISLCCGFTALLICRWIVSRQDRLESQDRLK